MRVKLSGIIGKMFGTEYTLDTQTPAEAIHALSCMVDGFSAFMKENFVCVWINGTAMDDLSELNCKLLVDTEVVISLPVMGAGGGSLFGGIFKVFKVFTPIIGYLGFGLGFDLVNKLLVPKMPTIQQDEDGNRASYGFGGAVTTITQGNVVPVAYGECLQGGFVLTYQITSDITRY